MELLWLIGSFPAIAALTASSPKHCRVWCLRLAVEALSFESWKWWITLVCALHFGVAQAVFMILKDNIGFEKQVDRWVPSPFEWLLNILISIASWNKIWWQTELLFWCSLNLRVGAIIIRDRFGIEIISFTIRWGKCYGQMRDYWMSCRVGGKWLLDFFERSGDGLRTLDGLHHWCSLARDRRWLCGCSFGWFGHGEEIQLHTFIDPVLFVPPWSQFSISRSLSTLSQLPASSTVGAGEKGS